MGHVATDHKFALKVEAMFLPGIGYFAGKINRIPTLGDNALQAKSLDLFDERRQFCPKLRIEPQWLGKMGADGIEYLPSLHQRQI